MIYKRQKLLLQVVEKLSENQISSKIYLVKTLFLLKQRLGSQNISYDFFPHKYGPFSNEIYQDFNLLEIKDLLNQEKLCLTQKGKEIINGFEKNDLIINELNNIIASFPNYNKIMNFVYEHYPKTTIRSEKILQKKQNDSGIYSIGYEGKTIDFFLNELIQNNVSILVDVRKNAFSMKKSFSKNRLVRCLTNAGISYLHLPELGIDSIKRKNLETKKDYQKLFKEYEKFLETKKQEINKIKELGKQQKIALMCFEADKNFCHRGILSDFLNQRVEHI